MRVARNALPVPSTATLMRVSCGRSRLASMVSGPSMVGPPVAASIRNRSAPLVWVVVGGRAYSSLPADSQVRPIMPWAPTSVVGPRSVRAPLAGSTRVSRYGLMLPMVYSAPPPKQALCRGGRLLATGVGWPVVASRRLMLLVLTV